MEVNPRLSQSVELAIRAGVDFPRMQLEWARGGTHPASGRAGARAARRLARRRSAPASSGRVAGSPPPRPRLGATLRAVVSDYLLHRARLEGFDLRDLRPMLGALAIRLRARVLGGPVRRRGTRRPCASPC